MGMVGGGRGAFIGAVHRMAAFMDGEIELVCGAFSSDPVRSKLSGEDLGLEEGRVYPDFKTMFEEESKLPPEERMHMVSIVTPNHMHFEPSMMALEYGFHVVCDKPLCFSLDEAYALRDRVRDSGMLFAVTHNYTGYPMVKQAKELVKEGNIGKIRRIIVEYSQGWLTDFIESEDQKQAKWRTDPKKSGVVGAMGDIGTHAENLAEYITGLKIEEVCAQLNIAVEGRLLDDDSYVMLKFDNGANGVLMASQISAGEENNLNIKVSGTEGTLEWHQMEPNTLKVYYKDKPIQVFRTGGMNNYGTALRAIRIPAGHPEGYLEGFANIYKEVARAVRMKLGYEKGKEPFDFPDINDGVRGMEFIDLVVKSHQSNEKWTKA